MDNKSYLENKAQEALNSLDGIQRADPGPFFYTRLKARMERSKRSVWENISGIISKPAITVFGLLLIVLLNTVAALNNEAAYNSTLTNQGEMAFVDEYAQVNSFFYDIENVQP
ncbi:MAG TPA: hypothetical protein PK339_10360 [Flavitalea sp.]|nr:hypothetical protein [Flavitalea sp.]